MKNLNKYKVEKYQVDNSNPQDFDQFSGYVEIKDRYRIIDVETGEIVDDAQGYGFKTKQGAYRCLHYKVNKSEILILKSEYKKLLKKYKYLETIQTELHNNILYSIKNNEVPTKKEIEKCVLFEIEKNIPELFSELFDETLKKNFLREFCK